MAPFMPFMAETLWQKTTGNNFSDENKSVHLEKWPGQTTISKDQSAVLTEMENIRKIVELGLAKRDEAGVKVRQQLAELRIKNYELKKDYVELLKDELNVKSIVSEKGAGEISVTLDITITEELKLEGIKREIVRFINALRKDTNLSLLDKTTLYYETDSKLVRDTLKKYAEDIMKDTLSEEIKLGVKSAEFKKDIQIEGEVVKLGVRKK
jgi:isoleucyl-tRNA synthetase